MHRFRRSTQVKVNMDDGVSNIRGLRPRFVFSDHGEAGGSGGEDVEGGNSISLFPVSDFLILMINKST